MKNPFSFYRNTKIISHPNRTFIHLWIIGVSYNTSYGSKKNVENSDSIHFAVGGKWNKLIWRIYYRSKWNGYLQ